MINLEVEQWDSLSNQWLLVPIFPLGLDEAHALTTGKNALHIQEP